MLDFSDKISEKYRLLRLQAEDKANYFRSLAEKDEKYILLDKEIKAVSLEIARSKYEKNDKFKVLETEKAMLEIKLLSVLNVLNIDIKSLQPNYLCKKCNDTGMIGNTACSCYKKYYSQFFTESFNVKIDKLPTFSGQELYKENEKIFNLFKNYCSKFPKSEIKNFLLQGYTGTGKTFIAECTARALIDKNYNVIYISAFNLIRIIKEYHYAFNKDVSKLLDVLINSDILIIDDLGTEPFERNITAEYVLAIIDGRQNNEKHTIITTNLNNGELADRYSERFTSRMNNKNFSRTIKFGKHNFRPQMN